MKANIVVTLCSIFQVLMSNRLGAFSAHSASSRTSSCSSSDHVTSFSSNMQMPQILSPGQVIRAQQGETVVMPCQVINLNPFCLMWKQSSRVLSADTLVIRKDPRMRLREDFSLELSGLMPEDQGAYTCEIDVMGKPISIEHTVEVLVPPAVQAMPQSGKVTIRKSKEFTLRCAAKGNPNPTISWSRESGLLPSGKATEDGLSLEMKNVDRQDGGLYYCTANNGVGQPARAAIEVEIKYPPEIELDQNWFQNGDDIDVELLCTVHSNPDSELSWYRQQKKLHENDRQLFQSRPGHLRLHILKINRHDFGNYSCKAENSLGKARAYISLSGRPRPPRFISDAIGHKPYTYNITWTTDSISPVLEYKMFYRQSDGLPFVQTEHVHELAGSWEKVFIPVSRPVNTFTVKTTYTVKHLQPGAVYDMVAIAKNEFGWSDYSKIFNFFNKGVDYSTQQLSAIAEQQMDNGESTMAGTNKKPPGTNSRSASSSEAAGDQHSRPVADGAGVASTFCSAGSFLILCCLQLYFIISNNNNNHALQ